MKTESASWPLQAMVSRPPRVCTSTCASSSPGRPPAAPAAQAPVRALLRAPLFFFAIGSQGNIGAAASAPVVAAAFHPTLAPVGVLLGTVGYATGTGLAYVTGLILKWMANG